MPAIAAAAASDADAVVRTFFDRYARGDLSGATRLWVSGAPADGFRNRHRLRLTRRCMRLEALAIESFDEDGGIVSTVETLALRARPDGQEWSETSHSRFVLRRVDGEWRIAEWTTRERELVDALAKATTTAERETILAAASDLQTNGLVRLMSKHAIDLVNQQRADVADELSSAAARIAQRLGDVAAMSAAASACSVVARAGRGGVRDFDRSLQFAHESVALAESSGDPDVQARALLRLARAVESAQGLPDPEPLERAIALAPESEDPAAASIAATTLARYYEAHNQPRDMFRLVEKAYEYAEESGDPSARINAAMLMAGEYHWTHDYVLAERYHRRVLELSLAAGFEVSATGGIRGLEQVHAGREGHAAALHILDEGLSTLRSPEARSVLLGDKADSLLVLGRVDEAEAAFEESLRLVPADATSSDGNEFFRAWLDFERHDYERALARIDRIKGDMHLVNYAGRLLKARIFYCTGRIAEAREVVEDLISLNDVSPLSDPQSSLFTVSRARDQARGYLVQILATQGQYAHAVEIVEQMKAGELREALNGGGIDPDASSSDEERQREKMIEKRIHELNRAWIAEHSPEQAAALHARLVETRADLNELRQRAYALDPVMRVQHPPVLSLDELPPSLDEVTIVSYLDATSVDPRGGRTPFVQSFVFVVRPKRGGHRRVTARIVGMSGVDLAQRIERFAKSIEQRNLRTPELAEELYEILLGPIEPEIRAAKSLCIIPDGSLWRVPFHALGRRGQKLLVERVPLFYAPSIAVLTAAESKREERRQRGAPTLLAFANPNSGSTTQSLYRALDRDASIGAIPEAEAEAHAIASIYGMKKSRLFVGANARETAFKTQAPHFDVLHLATHGIAYASAPMFSSLLLATSARDPNEDGVLEAREIASLRLDADLAVLSACETGKGDLYGGGVIGLSWAFLAAGCPTTVVSQWKAESAATAKLMIEFHRQLSRGASKPVALQRAQLAVRSDPRYRHPFYWAPFVVIGAP